MIEPRPGSGELRDAFAGRRVLVTGHTGFKGGWLTLWLSALGARVTGLALAADSRSIYRALALDDCCESVVQDVRDAAAVAEVVRRAQPEVVFHLAAQPLVRASYEAPLETLTVNTLGTANLLEAVRMNGLRCAVVAITSDKCYRPSRNAESSEVDEIGGEDPYSCSKAAAELVVEAWRRSYFRPERLESHGVAIATARAGNAIGGGDYASDRLLPDAVRAWRKGAPLELRHPDYVRPWQHVVEPLGGYLLLAAELLRSRSGELCGAWNFGPSSHVDATVAHVADAFARAWNPASPPAVRRGVMNGRPELPVLRLSTRKAESLLGWRPRWHLSEAIARTAVWYTTQDRGASAAALRDLTLTQITDWLGSPAADARGAPA